MESKQATSFVEALCRHREILRRETTFLRREVTSRNLATIAGKRAYLESQFSNREPPPQQQEMMVSAKSERTKEVIRLPYLVGSHEEALDLLLHEADQLRYRIQSLASILGEFPIIISSEKKAKMSRLMCQALVAISEHIMKSFAVSAAAKGEEVSYYEHCAGWRSTWGSRNPSYGVFDDITTLSPMHFTCSTPGAFPHSASTATALQIYSIKIIDVHPILGWPLYVYGVVAIRDTVDRNRNLLFCRSRANCQMLTQDDPFLHLTGPSRAILAAQDIIEEVTFEVELKIKYGVESQHTAFLSCNYCYSSVYDTPELRGGCCTARISLEQFRPAIQATIVGVCIVEGGWPFKDGGRISCFMSSAEHREVVLLDCRGGETPVGPDDYFRLSRNVVTVEVQETLRVVVQGYAELSGQAQEGHVDFPVKRCQTSEGECSVGNSMVKVIVAWSLVVRDKQDL